MAEPSTRASRGWLFALQLAIGAVALWFAGARLAADWGNVNWSRLDVTGGAVARACAWSAPAVLVAFAVLIETWRRVLTAWGGALAPIEAAHIWFVSNLGRWIPGKVWQVGAMAALAERAGVSGVAATGASIVVNLVNLVAGGAVLVAAALGGIDVLGASGVGMRGAWIGAVVIAAALGASPLVIPRAASLAARLLGRPDPAVRVPGISIAMAFAGCTAGWVLYGLGFWALSGALGSAVTMGPLAAIAVYTASYLFGYLMLFAPGGLVFREAMLVTTMTQLHLAGATEALVIAALSRLWITVIEVVPGLLFLFRRPPAAPTTR
ncbi:MAG: flippase-like domain-containing protein [Gemmatimonadetes bacterium]|nr:flippase-like domain-containing protein [Gemmatimonadota bacterium]